MNFKLLIKKYPLAEKIEKWNLKKKKEKENIRKYLKIIKIFPNKVKIRNALISFLAIILK